ncbi:MAG: hypothetical protein RLZZ524_763 [Pseudomonadota bacterium]|jgi:hypothetical protein
MSHKKQPCLHCALNKAIDAFLADNQADPNEQEVQRAVLSSLANVVSDRIASVHPALRLIAFTDFAGTVATFVQVDAQADVMPMEGEHVH